MEEHWKTYNSHWDVPELCQLELAPESPFSGQIGMFPACGSKVESLIQIILDPNEWPIEHTAWTGLCGVHTASLMKTMPARYILRVEKQSSRPTKWIAQ